MSTDTTIPDDIDRIATDIVRADYSKDGQEPDWLLYLAIAKAIHDAVMAERERCARIADDEASGRDWQRADANAQNDKRAARDFESMKIEAVQIASAIRAAPKAGV